MRWKRKDIAYEAKTLYFLLPFFAIGTFVAVGTFVAIGSFVAIETFVTIRTHKIPNVTQTTK